MDIDQLTANAAEQYDLDEKGAADLVETYLTQIEQLDRKTIDRENITDEDAECVMTAIEAGSENDLSNDQTLCELAEIRDQLNELDNQMGDLINRRDDIINHLLDRCEPIRNIVENSGLSRQRIHVIRNREGQ